MMSRMRRVLIVLVVVVLLAVSVGVGVLVARWPQLAGTDDPRACESSRRAHTLRGSARSGSRAAARLNIMSHMNKPTSAPGQPRLRTHRRAPSRYIDANYASQPRLSTLRSRGAPVGIPLQPPVPALGRHHAPGSTWPSSPRGQPSGALLGTAQCSRRHCGRALRPRASTRPHGQRWRR